MRGLRIAAFLSVLLWACGSCLGATGKIIKVLPHFLDKEGRHTVHPSLLERDAYQANLRRHPELCSGLRFDIQWKIKEGTAADLKVRVELQGSTEPRAKPFVIDLPVKARTHWSHWSTLTLKDEPYRKLGDILAWRATLWSGDQLLAEQKSFLW